MRPCTGRGRQERPAIMARPRPTLRQLVPLRGGEVMGETQGSWFSATTAGTFDTQGGRSRTRAQGTTLCILARPPLSALVLPVQDCSGHHAQALVPHSTSEPLALPLSEICPCHIHSSLSFLCKMMGHKVTAFRFLSNLPRFLLQAYLLWMRSWRSRLD